MTALKPIENRRVRGVASETYPINAVCAHPDCSGLVTLKSDGTPTVHHIFPRSLTKSKSYFVEITEDDGSVRVLPHAVGLCGSGTTGHHGDVEAHRAWIKLEDGQYVWYDRHDRPPRHDDEFTPAAWTAVGPLNPQPGSVEGKPKRKRLKGDARRKRKTFSIRVPDDAGEDGAALLDEAVEALEDKIMGEEAHRPIYYTIMSALDYTNLNADETDFS